MRMVRRFFHTLEFLAYISVKSSVMMFILRVAFNMIKYDSINTKNIDLSV